MNILVISDSHRVIKPIYRVLTLYREQVSMVVHLGDHAGDLTPYAKDFPGIEMVAVAGNCDYGLADDQEKILTVNGRRILLTHGHRQNVKMSCERLIYYAEEKEVDACLFGHTHTPVVFESGRITFLNPGSISEPRVGSRPGYGLLTVSDQGVIRGTVLSLHE